MDTLKCSKRLCKKLPKWNAVYDSGIGEQNLILCEFHYNSDKVFQRNIKTIEEVHD